MDAYHDRHVAKCQHAKQLHINYKHEIESIKVDMESLKDKEEYLKYAIMLEERKHTVSVLHNKLKQLRNTNTKQYNE
jgi:hypothetical protein